MRYRVNRIIVALLLSFNVLLGFAQNEPVKLGVSGLTHGHVHWVFNSEARGDFEIVGIVESNKELAQRFANRYNFSMDIVFDKLETMIQATNPQAVSAFGSTYEHLEVVEVCAPKGIHVMVEKPLAVSMEHALKMKALAEENQIHLITNYETTWYPTNHEAKKWVQENHIGPIRKIIVSDGHKGPKKIGVDEEFLDWLTDPVKNGGGAITDFGCYGANLATWLMDGKRPLTVTAITQQFQAENNPEVDDESIILLTYEKSNVIIQGSWNWPIGRKDMEIYGPKGAIYADDNTNLRMHITEGYSDYSETAVSLEKRVAPFDDPFAYFVAVIKDEINVKATDLSSLENNMIVVEILDAAKRSAAAKKTIILDP